MRTLALYWNTLVEMFRDPVDPAVVAREETGEAPEVSCLSLALRQIGVVDRGAVGAEKRGP